MPTAYDTCRSGRACAYRKGTLTKSVSGLATDARNDLSHYMIELHATHGKISSGQSVAKVVTSRFPCGFVCLDGSSSFRNYGNSHKWERKVLWCTHCSYSWANVRDVTFPGIVVLWVPCLVLLRKFDALWPTVICPLFCPWHVSWLFCLSV